MHLRGRPLTGASPNSQPGTNAPHRWQSVVRAQKKGARSPAFSPLRPSDPSGNYDEIAPAVSSPPISPSFVLGPFPDFLTHSYFADITALPVGCYTLKNIGVTSHSLLVRDGALLTSDQLNISEPTIAEAARYGRLCAEAEFSRTMDEPLVSLAGLGHLIYGHWLVDFLPKLYLLKQCGVDPFGVKYLLPANTPRFAIAWLELLGISSGQLVFFEPYAEVIGASSLIVPTLLRTNGRTHPLFRSAIEYLISLIPRETRQIQRKPGGKRLYLTRGVPGPENRKLVNRQAIEQLAADAGYAIVRPESLPLHDQLAMFASAKCIVGEYGSALHGSLFSASGTTVCPLRASARHPGFLQSGLCQAMDQKIGYVFGSAAEHDIEQEFVIQVKDFETALALIDMC